MKPTTFAYVCAPFQNSEGFPSHKAKDYCRILYELGYIPIAPNLMFSRFLRESVPEQREARRDMAQQLLRRCRVLVVCGDKITEEMEAEILLAKRLRIVSTTLAGIRTIALYGKRNEDTE